MTFEGQTQNCKKNRTRGSGFYHVYGGERGIWTLGRAVALHMISNHAPSATRTPLQVLHVVAIQQCSREKHPTYKCGRGDRIWTCDLLVPNQARYQTALRPVTWLVYNTILRINVKHDFTTFYVFSHIFFHHPCLFLLRYICSFCQIKPPASVSTNNAPWK